MKSEDLEFEKPKYEKEYSLEDIERKLEKLKSKGYDKEQILEMAEHPTTICGSDQAMQSSIPDIDLNKNLNPIGTVQFIGRDGKPYSSMEELSRADAMYENRQVMQSSIPDIDLNKNLNPIDTVQFIGRDGKPYSSMEELSRADAMYENRQVMQSSIPDIDDSESYHRHR